MTKKDKILNLFNSIEWVKSPSGELVKIISGDQFHDVGLYHAIENSQQHCDVIYAKRIIQKLGHKVLIGHSFYIYKDKMK